MGDKYQGDAAFFTEGRVSLQIHSVDVEDSGKKVLHRAGAGSRRFGCRVTSPVAFWSRPAADD